MKRSQGRTVLTWGLMGLLTFTYPLEITTAFAAREHRLAQRESTAPSGGADRGWFFSPTPILEYSGEDDPKEPEDPKKPEEPKKDPKKPEEPKKDPKKPEEPKKPPEPPKTSPQPPSSNPPRTLDVPRELSDLRRDLRIGQIWVVQTADRPTAVRVSIEITDRVIGSITLNPETGQPVVFQERSNHRPSSAPESTQLAAMLQTVRAQMSEIKFGTFVLPSPRGLEIQVYLSGKLVGYVYLDPKSGDAVTDDNALREISSSSIRLR